MKQEITKFIINDLNMAGIFDIPANSFMDMQKIESSDLVKKAFGLQDSLLITENNLSQSESLTNSIDVADEVSSLFANFDNSLKSDEESDDVKPVKIKAIQAKKAKFEKNDRRELAKTKRKEKEFITKTTKKAEKPIPVELPEPNIFVSVKQSKSSKIILVINEKNEKTFKNKEEFNLLENILKSANLTLKDISLIFIDDGYKQIALHSENYTNRLAQVIKQEVRVLKDDIIFCFGQDCLRLTLGKKVTIKDIVSQVDIEFEGKKVFANYSLSAMLNTPKYKRLTWNNILKLTEN
ncbi:MAG: hypothetical protein GY793_06720 [Proteobacteria bacterium]|nr:hypothetical protein [Pseudomonadota bacterium]